MNCDLSHAHAIPAWLERRTPLIIMSNDQPRTSLRNVDIVCRPHMNHHATGSESLYIRGKKLHTNELLILALLAVPFIIAIATTFWDRFLLEQTISCSEDPDVHCFPLAIHPATNSDLNISSNTARITDCSIWITGNISKNVTFRCFKCVNRFKDAIGAVGGLITIFNLSIKLVIALFLFITTHSIKLLMCFKCINLCTPNCAKAAFKCIRVFLGLTLAAVESLVASYLGYFYIAHKFSSSSLTDHKSIVYNIIDNINEPLGLFGIVTTSLLLPLEEYNIDVGKRRDYDNIEGQNLLGNTNTDEASSSV